MHETVYYKGDKGVYIIIYEIKGAGISDGREGRFSEYKKKMNKYIHSILKYPFRRFEINQVLYV